MKETNNTKYMYTPVQQVHGSISGSVAPYEHLNRQKEAVRQDPRTWSSTLWLVQGPKKQLGKKEHTNVVLNLPCRSTMTVHKMQ